jgi:hypothetical protein
VGSGVLCTFLQWSVTKLNENGTTTKMEERSSGKRKPCTHLENSSMSSAEKCISSSTAASENLPVLLCKLKFIIFNTFSIHLELSFGSFVGVVGTVLYCNLKRKVL